MRRVRATGLALANWKGVFFERYLFDRHVTALEGANGAGKTTVMIAAYVVLLPDMSRLRFTNLGETAATGGDRGVWGRLGEPGRPSYAALDFELADGRRVIAGVQLVRKAEPSVELNPFLVSELDPGVRLSDLLLVSTPEHDAIPSMEELAANVARASARLTVFQTSKDYFAALFEHGVLPLRLSSDEERNKLNEVLRTSMTGGISRALTSELRSFLLREEASLSDTLTRMRGNLEACRRTRAEVLEARALEHEISGIFDAGSAMFAAAFGSARQRVAEASARAETFTQRMAQAERELAELEAELRRAASREAAQAERRKQAQAELGEAIEQLRRADQAAAVAAHLASVSLELAEREQELAGARAQRDASIALRQQRKIERDRAREGYELAARGLADSKSGLDELHRNAAAERQLRRLLDEVRQLLGDGTVSLETLAEQREKVTRELAQLDRKSAERDRERELFAVRRRDFEQALAALRQLLGDEALTEPYEQGRQALRRLGELRLSAARQAELAAAYERATSLLPRQASARQRARSLGFDTASAAFIRRQLQSGEEELARLDAECAERRAQSAGALSAAQDKRREAERVAAERPRFEDFSRRKQQLEGAHNASLTSEADFDALEARFIAEREQIRLEVTERSRQREVVQAMLSALVLGGNNLDPELVALRDELDGELLASRFEELGIDEAATIEAELGPLARGLLVTDAESAARELAGRPRQLESVFLVSEGALAVRAANTTLVGDDLIVRESYGVRLTRRPARPVLGRLARKRRIEELETNGANLERSIEELEQRSRALAAALRECQALKSLARRFGSEVLPAGDELEHGARELSNQAAAHEEAARECADAAAELRLRARELTFLLEDAFLLEAPDYAEQSAALEAELEASRRAQEELTRSAAAAAELATLLDALRSAPPREGAEREAELALAELTAERDRWFKASSLLEELARSRGELRFADAERLLEEQAALLPTLSAQHDAARDAHAAADTALERAELDWESAAARFAEADAARAAVEAHQRRLREELSELGAVITTSITHDALRSRISERSALLVELEGEERRSSAERGARAERAEQVKAKLRALEEERGRAQTELEPQRRTLAELTREAESMRLSTSFEPRPALEARGSSELAAEAQAKLDLLLGRLATARGGRELMARLEEPTAEPARCLRIWVAVREWLTERVPAQIANVDEPLIALERLRDQLSTLEQRLGRQELDLRGASEDVARGIEVGIRRAKAQVRRLNQTLDGIAFGSIQGIRVQLRRVERMDQVLAALRDGAAQELLFQSNLPIEEAFNEIFRRFAGGKSGAQKLLDYREYLELGVEVQRRATTEWELANPARLSTGEAIGVGATLMMVVLTEWERDANLLRGQRSGGTLRFLFLDEANRLSQDNLAVLFELCKTLDLQLLIAAPEVARAEGNTTYRLVRRLTEAGAEEVIVTGRRRATADERGALEPEAEAPPANEPPANEPRQIELLS